MVNSGTPSAPLLTPEAARAAMTLILQRQERFTTRHPEIDIRAQREDGRLVFYVTEPGRDVAEWPDPSKMLDDLEARYPGMSSDDIAAMDDPDLIAERRRVREALERTPPCEISPELRQRFWRLDDEFDRRARAAWADAS